MKRELFPILIIALLTGCSSGTNTNSVSSQDKAVTSESQLGSQVKTEEAKPIEQPKQDEFKDQITFRNTGWGMSKEQVKETEKSIKIVDEDQDGLLYKDTVDSLDTDIIYQFADNKLARSAYNITEEHTNKTTYIDDYKRLKEIISKKYGKPKDDKEVWKDDLYKDDPSEWGMAIAVGHLVYLSSWETPNTNIQLMLAGDNFKIGLMAVYTSKELSKILDQKNQHNTSNKF